jgi:hypothetical protein
MYTAPLRQLINIAAAAKVLSHIGRGPSLMQSKDRSRRISIKEVIASLCSRSFGQRAAGQNWPLRSDERSGLGELFRFFEHSFEERPAVFPFLEPRKMLLMEGDDGSLGFGDDVGLDRGGSRPIRRMTRQSQMRIGLMDAHFAGCAVLQIIDLAFT